MICQNSVCCLGRWTVFSSRFVSFHDRHDAVIVLKLFAPGGNEDIIDSCLKPLTKELIEMAMKNGPSFTSQVWLKPFHRRSIRQSFHQTLMMSFGMTCDLPNRNVAVVGTQHVEGTLQDHLVRRKFQVDPEAMAV